MKLTTPMRNALQQAQHAPLRRVHNPTVPGKPPWPAHPSTLHALARHDLVTVDEIRNRHGYHVQVWTITDAGQEALKPRETVRRDKPVWLAQPGDHGDYTTDPSRRKFPEEVIDPDSIESAWRQESEARHTAIRREHGKRLDQQALSQRIDNLQSVARTRYVDVSSDVRLIRHMVATGRPRHALKRLERVETQLRQRAA